MTETTQANWETVALGNIATIERTGISPEHIETGTTYVGLENIATGGSFVDVGQVSNGELASTKFVFTPEHVLFGKLRPYLAKIACPDFGGVCSTDILPILPGPKLDRRFLCYFLRQPHMVDFATSRCTGANLPRLSPAKLAEFQIPLPPLSEQRRIADILDKADTIRRKRQEVVSELLLVPGSAFHEMFGSPSHNPKGWEIGTIRDLVSEVKYGTSSKAGAAGKFPILRMNNITYEGTWDLSDLKYIDIPAEDESKYLVRKGDLLFNRTNSKELVGKTAAFQEDTPMAFAGYLVRARTTKDAHPEYIAGYLNSPYGKATLRHMCKSIIGMANINAQEFQDIKIPKPPLEAQLEYVAVIDGVRSSEKPLQAALAEADCLFNSLVRCAFKGEL